MARKSIIYAATEAAKEQLEKGEYKRRCATGCACGATEVKGFTGTVGAAGAAGETVTAPAKK